MAEQSISIPSSALKIDRLTKDNWQVWKVRMKAVLIALGLSEHLEHEVKPEKADEKVWKENAVKALAMVSMAVSDSELPLIESCKSVAEAMKKLKEMHEDHGATQIIYLLEQLFALKYDEGTDMQQHITTAITLRNKITSLVGENISWDKMVGLKLLCSLPPSYSPLVMSLQQTINTLNMSNVSSMLLGKQQEENMLLVMGLLW